MAYLNPTYLLSTGLLFLLLSCGVGKEYEIVRQSDKPGPYETFLLKHPKSKYAEDAKLRLYAAQQLTDYRQAKQTQSIGLYEAFVQSYPESKLTPLAKEELLTLKDDRDWRIAKNTDEPTYYRLYLNTYPETTHRQEAINRIKELEITAEYEAAIKADTEPALRSFIERFPKDDRVSSMSARIERLEELASWGKAVAINTAEAFRSFYTRYPAAQEAGEARVIETRLIEEELYQAARKDGSLVALKGYLLQYPDGKYADKVQKELDELEIHEPAWRKAERLNTIQGYELFAKLHARSSRARIAEIRAMKMKQEEDRIKAEAAEARRLKKIRDELNLFERAERNKTKRDYQRYMQKYPNGRYFDDAERALIDLEVAEIFRGDYGKLPPMQRNGYGSYSEITSISVQNDTNYTLTVRYSGPTSKKIEIPKGGNRSFSLGSGAYRITASVNARNVQNYAGSESLSGGEYSSKFYIETSTMYRRY